MARIFSMKMKWIVIIKIHSDQNPIKRLITGTGYLRLELNLTVIAKQWPTVVFPFEQLVRFMIKQAYLK